MRQTSNYAEMLAESLRFGGGVDTFTGELVEALAEELEGRGYSPSDDELDNLFKHLSAFAQGLEADAVELVQEQDREAMEAEREFQQTKREVQLQ